MFRERTTRQSMCLVLAVNIFATGACISYVLRAEQDRAQIMFENWGGHLFEDQGRREAWVIEDWVGTDEDLVHLRSLGNIHKIWLFSPKVTNRSMQLLAGMPQVEEIKISNCRLDEHGVTLLGRFQKLKRVSIRGVAVSDEVCTTLGQLPALESLHAFDCEKVSQFGLEAIFAKSSLEELILYDVPPESLERFCRTDASFKSELKRVRLSVAHVDIATVVALCHRLPSLKVLHLANSQLRNASLEQLRAAVPNVNILHVKDEPRSVWDDCFGPNKMFGKSPQE